MSTLLEELASAKSDALDFLRRCVRRGLAHSYDTLSGRWVKPYPEVTGYLLSLFCSEEPEAAHIAAMAHRLLQLQQPCGGFRSFSGKRVYVFDTAQICHGLLDYHMHTGSQKAFAACRHGADFIIYMQLSTGAFFPVYDEARRERASYNTNWGHSFSPINCKCVEFLSRMAEVSGKQEYARACERVCLWALDQPQLLFSHPGAYSLEGLLSGGYETEVRNRLQEHFIPRMDNSGFLAYHPNLPYAYVSGSVQIALLCARVGLTEPALRIWHWVRRVHCMHDSSGLFQYANPDGTLNTDVHAEINSWGTKYYVELANSLISTAIADRTAAAH